tara:strand:+ start:585 stop:890 length:306 start_codon:yes stop_codon:yes gene_type:complete
MNYEDQDNITSFLLEIQKLQLQMETTVQKYGFQDSIISINLCGVMVEEGDQDNLKAVFGYNVPDREVLEDILDFIKDTYNPGGDDDEDLGTMLNDLGISLN